ncbi:MAG TPA: hypothetical protein PK402_04630 [Tepidisphaeraceae bacterium]|nr:hypothetical protein [Tepidisphaeraceae bacterium]
MQNLSGLAGSTTNPSDDHSVEHITRVDRLDRILRFANHSIDDVINCPIARNEVIFVHRVHKLIERRSEIIDLEKQWNRLGVRAM